MSTEISLIYTVDNITCAPINCGVGESAALQLKDGLADKSADGSGWLVATIATAQPYCSNAGSGKWQYIFSIPDSEIAEGQTVAATDILGACCIGCDVRMVLDKQQESLSTNHSRVSAELYALSDGLTAAQQIQNGDHVAYRFHSAHILYAFEVAMDSHLAGYPYAEEPGEVTFTVIQTPQQANTPWSNLVDANGDPVRAIVDPASSTPLTARFRVSPPVEIAGGIAIGANIVCEDPTAHLGAQIHYDIQTIDPE